MGKKKSTCLYLDAIVVETARKLGLNISKVSENALIQAIRKLRSPEQETDLNSRANLEGRDRDSNPGAGLHRPVG
jgi:post-segregation antitoxin (ccd killing protein)